MTHENIREDWNASGGDILHEFQRAFRVDGLSPLERRGVKNEFNKRIADFFLAKFAARDAEAVRHDPLNRECTRYNCDFSDYKKHQLSCPCSCSSKHDDQQREFFEATKTYQKQEKWQDEFDQQFSAPIDIGWTGSVVGGEWLSARDSIKNFITQLRARDRERMEEEIKRLSISKYPHSSTGVDPVVTRSSDEAFGYGYALNDTLAIIKEIYD